MTETTPEQCVIGGVLVDPSLYPTVAHLSPLSFENHVSRLVWQAIQDVEVIDVMTVWEKLKQQGSDKLLQPTDLSRLMDGIPRLSNVKHYADIVERRARVREIKRRLTMAIGKVEDDPSEEIAAALKLCAAVGTGESVEASAAVGALLDDMEARQQGTVVDEAEEHGTGIQLIDEYLRGLKPGKLYILAARPSMGKTALALQLVEHVSRRFPALLFEQEMDAREIMERMVSTLTRIEASRIQHISKDRPLANDEWDRCAEAFRSLEKRNLTVCDRPGMTLAQVTAEVLRVNSLLEAQGKPKLKLVAFDYLQIAGLRGNRNEAIGEFTMGLKNLARKEGFAALLLSQLRRADRKDYDKKGLPPLPKPEDLRDSGNIEQDADVVMFLHRPEYYLLIQGKDPGIWKDGAQLLFSKHRGGPVGNGVLGWRGDIMTFTDPWWEDE